MVGMSDREEAPRVVRASRENTYDWSELTDEKRFRRARATTEHKLRASLDRLAAAAESR